jgi:urease accessory protein
MSAVIADATAPGWQAELELGFEPADGRTVLARRRHLGPLRVQRPFYPDGPVCNVYIVHPPGGVVGGDRLDLRFDAGPGAHALLTTPAAGKFYRTAADEAVQKIEINLTDARFEWLPQETIYYPGARVRQKTVVSLDSTSRFIGWDIGSYGLMTRGERFDSGHVHQAFELWRGDRPLLIDRLHLAGEGRIFDALWGLSGHCVLGTLLAYPATSVDIDAARAALEAQTGITLGISLVDGVLIARVLARQADAATRAAFELWRVLRPRLLQREAVSPRIWAT